LSHPTPANSQPERTVLAWTRTSFALLANGVLLTIKNLHHAIGLAATIPALLAGIAASGTYVIALRRQRTLEQRPIPTHINPRRQVYAVGMAVLVLIVVTAITQLL
jgi:uncharacterized membrane protein YidH (DUF202 family)